MTLTSPDGTTIGYRTLGSGPALVIAHGGMGSGHNHLQQAEALADAFTVHLPDRRGRGLSGPYREPYTIGQDVEDLTAVIEASGAEYLFGLSTGGLIALQTALTVPRIRKLAVFDAPVSTAPLHWAARFERELAAGRTAAALVTALLGAEMGPRALRFVPRWLLERGTEAAMKKEDRQGSGDYVAFRELAQTLRYDIPLIREMNGRLAAFRDLRAETLLMGGGKSPPFQKAALIALEGVLPDCRRVEFAGMGHAGPWNADRGGQPRRVADELRRFFS